MASVALHIHHGCLQSKGQDYLNGEVIERNDEEILVAYMDESTGQLIGTEISVAKREPLKITKIYVIYGIDENWEVIPNA